MVVHPQSIVHSLVEFADGSMLAQLGTTDMRMPIQYAFSYPERWAASVPFLDLARAGTLEFHAPAWDEFPCLGLAFRALEADRSLPIVLNAANEVAVASFLDGTARLHGHPRRDCGRRWTRTIRPRWTPWPPCAPWMPGPAGELVRASWRER